jgi:hypothetical protein
MLQRLLRRGVATSLMASSRICGRRQGG